MKKEYRIKCLESWNYFQPDIAKKSKLNIAKNIMVKIVEVINVLVSKKCLKHIKTDSLIIWGEEYFYVQRGWIFKPARELFKISFINKLTIYQTTLVLLYYCNLCILTKIVYFDKYLCILDKYFLGNRDSEIWPPNSEILSYNLCILGNYLLDNRDSEIWGPIGPI